MMTTQKMKPLPAQHRKVEPLTEKVEPVTPLHPQFEVLQERMNHLATREQMAATTMQMHKLHGEAMERMATKADMHATVAQMNKLHGEAMARMDVMQAHMDHMATKAEMHKLHGEAMGQMDKLHGKAMERIGNVETRMGVMESDLKSIKWIVGTLGVAIVVGLITIIAGLAKLIFFPVV